MNTRNAGWLIILAVILVSIPLALTFDVMPHAVTFAIAGLCSLVVIGAALWCADALPD